MGAWAGKRQRPCANMDSARSLNESCVNYELIKSKPRKTRGEYVSNDVYYKGTASLLMLDEGLPGRRGNEISAVVMINSPSLGAHQRSGGQKHPNRRRA